MEFMHTQCFNEVSECFHHCCLLSLMENAVPVKEEVMRQEMMKVESLKTIDLS